jgi:DNA-binding LacI/PurR family transcriptional regulator
VEDAAEAVRGLLADDPQITAVIVPNLLRLAAVMQAAYQLHLRIPDDLSVVSVLDADLADRAAPPLTNVDFPSQAMGRIGAELLIDQLEDHAAPVRQILLPPQLRSGQSTAPPRTRAMSDGFGSTAVDSLG